MLHFIYDGKQASISDNQQSGNSVGMVCPNNSSYKVNLVTTLSFRSQKVKKITNSLFPLLKSNLQKQVRRQDIRAVETCRIMLEMNDFETLRRLCIIAAEDVQITTETSVIAWLMAATSKDYLLSDHDKNFILGYVTNLVYCISYTAFEGGDHTERDFSLENIIESSFLQKGVLAGIYLRSCYGGLVGDIPMYINACYSAYQHGLRSFYEIRVPETELDFHPAAVDFHIYPKLCDLISSDTGLDSEIIKRVIWTCSSGINTRKNTPISEDDYQVWMVIEKSFKLHTLNYLAKITKMYF